MMPDTSTSKLADLVSKRLACLTQLRAIGKKQAELIATSQTAELLRLLAGKQQLITALQRIETLLQPFHDQDPEDRDWASPAARAKCASEAEACRGLLAEVLQLEQANEQQMTVRRDELASQLQSASEASRARGAYRVHQPSRPTAARDAAPEGGDRPAASTLDLTSES